MYRYCIYKNQKSYRKNHTYLQLIGYQHLAKCIIYRIYFCFSVKSVKPVPGRFLYYCFLDNFFKNFIINTKKQYKMGSCNCRKKRKINLLKLTDNNVQEKQETTNTSANNDENDKKSKLDMLKSI